MFINFALIFDLVLFWLCYQSTASYDGWMKSWCRAAFLIWWLSTKVVKLIGLFKCHPRDIVFLPLLICFGYVHTWIKAWALLTLDEVRPTSTLC
jgi:hypothetical protein